MALVITNLLRSSSLILFSVLFFSSCVVKYYSHDIKKDIEAKNDDEINSYLPNGFPDNMDVFTMEMNSAYYYKNNIRENMLMSENSRHINQAYFFKNNDVGQPKKFQRYEVWLSKREDSKLSLQKGEKAAMVSYKGKKDSSGADYYQIVKVFLGHIETNYDVLGDKKEITTFVPDFLLEYTGNSKKCVIKKCQKRGRCCKFPKICKTKTITKECFCSDIHHKIKRKKIKRNGKSELNIEAILRLEKDKLANWIDSTAVVKIDAIVNKNYNAFAGEKSIIFDLTQLYGEPVWLKK